MNFIIKCLYNYTVTYTMQVLNFFLPGSWVQRAGWRLVERPDQQLLALDLKPTAQRGLPSVQLHVHVKTFKFFSQDKKIHSKRCWTSTNLKLDETTGIFPSKFSSVNVCNVCTCVLYYLFTQYCTQYIHYTFKSLQVWGFSVTFFETCCPQTDKLDINFSAWSPSKDSTELQKAPRQHK